MLLSGSIVLKGEIMLDVMLAIAATMLLLGVLLGGCEKSPPPTELPKPAPDLMVKPAALPQLPENKGLTLKPLYAHAAKVQGQCVMDQTRLDHLQQYVSKLTGK